MRFSAESLAPPPIVWTLPHANSSAASSPVVPGNYFRWKFRWERCLAAVALLPGIVIIGVVAMLVRLTSRGPAIYRQLRVGRHGRPFFMYKIRTMRHDAEVTSGPVWARPGDPRVTPLGRVLRKVHLDEVPQLFNVLKGEMSLVGPRPERPEFTQQLALRIPNYLERLTVLPGITGLAQINLPPDSDLDSVRRKVLLDLEYITTASCFLDLRMLLCTAVRLLGIQGELAMRMFALKRPIPVLRPAAAAAPRELDHHSLAAVDLVGPHLLAAENRTTVNHTTVNHTAVGHNGATSNGVALHGLATNGAAANGTAINGATINGAASNGAASNGAASNGAVSNGAVSNGAVPKERRRNLLPR
jgi:lipopolysaccharide/colanic/teichoic acid biosynthesis glycosyltransferase